MTHGQWLVRNFLIHDNVSGMLALERKEAAQLVSLLMPSSCAAEIVFSLLNNMYFQPKADTNPKRPNLPCSLSRL
eukprot:scaffold33695_cov96-Skeletonema_marinoi.AAC.2